jgi:hypothetical protein
MNSVPLPVRSPGVELTVLLARRAREMSRAPLLLASVDALAGIVLARGWHSALRFPGMCLFGCLFATNVWGICDRALEEWHAVSHRSVRVALLGLRGTAGMLGIGACFLFLCSALLLGMGTYFR